MHIETQSSKRNSNSDPTRASIREAKLSKVRNIGQFVLGDKLGEGTFGTVCLGTHILTGERVAVKILEKKRILEQADITRVEREIQILKMLRHNNIIHLYAVIQTNSTIYLIMEYASNKELFDYIIAKKRLPEMEVCQFYQQIVSGIDYLHKLGVAHRDLKPENLLLNSNHELKIVDFGLSNLYHKGKLLSTACGSPCYAAPEMINGKQYKGVEVDVWSSGIILYAMLCGHLPFEDQSNDVLYKKITDGKFAIPTYISDQAKDMLRKILNTDPLKRYTIAQIKSHEWFNIIDPTLNINEGLLINSNVIPIDEEIVSTMEEYDYNKREVRENVLLNKHNHITTTYYLLLKKKVRKGIPSVADLNSPLFIQYIKQPENLCSRYHNNLAEVVLERATSKTLVKGDDKNKKEIEQQQQQQQQFNPPSLTSPKTEGYMTEGRESKSKELERTKARMKELKRQFNNKSTQIQNKGQRNSHLNSKANRSISSNDYSNKTQRKCILTTEDTKHKINKSTSIPKTPIKTLPRRIDFNSAKKKKFEPDALKVKKKYLSSVTIKEQSIALKTRKRKTANSVNLQSSNIKAKTIAYSSKRAQRRIEFVSQSNKGNRNYITINIALDGQKVPPLLTVPNTSKRLKPQKELEEHKNYREDAKKLNTEGSEPESIRKMQALNKNKTMINNKTTFNTIINKSQPRYSLAISSTDEVSALREDIAVLTPGHYHPKHTYSSSSNKPASRNMSSNSNKVYQHKKALLNSKESTRLMKHSKTINLYNPKRKAQPKSVNQNRTTNTPKIIKDTKENKCVNTSARFDKANDENQLYSDHFYKSLERDIKSELMNQKDNNEQKRLGYKNKNKKFNVIIEEDEYNNNRKKLKSYNTHYYYKSYSPLMAKLYFKTKPILANPSRNSEEKSLRAIMNKEGVIQDKTVIIQEQKIKQCRTPFDLSCVLFNSLANIKAHILKAMNGLKIKAESSIKQPNKFVCSEKKSDIKFSLELYQVNQLPDAYIIRPLRTYGNLFTYRELINIVLSNVLSS